MSIQTNKLGSLEYLTAEAAPKATPVRSAKKAGPNDPCPCGSGKKYKKCCMQKDKTSGMDSGN